MPYVSLNVLSFNVLRPKKFKSEKGGIVIQPAAVGVIGFAKVSSFAKVSATHEPLSETKSGFRWLDRSFALPRLTQPKEVEILLRDKNAVIYSGAVSRAFAREGARGLPRRPPRDKLQRTAAVISALGGSAGAATGAISNLTPGSLAD